MTGLGYEALRTAVLKTLSDDVGEAITSGKRSLLAAMLAADSEKTAARLPDGTKVASLPVVAPSSSPRVTDVAAFEAWVCAAHPNETEVVVRDSFRKKCLDDAKKAGRALDRASGETIPGITFEPTTPYVKVDFATGDRGGRELIRRAWRDGVISLPDVLDGLALPAGENGGTP